MLWKRELDGRRADLPLRPNGTSAADAAPKTNRRRFMITPLT